MTQRIRPGTVAAIALLLAAATGCTGQQSAAPAPSGPAAARGAAWARTPRGPARSRFSPRATSCRTPP